VSEFDRKLVFDAAKQLGAVFDDAADVAVMDRAIAAALAEMEPVAAPVTGLAWGAKVSATFRDRVRWIAEQLGIGASDLMACMAWESGRSFSASVANMAGSGATGLIQFMPATARALGTSTVTLAAMSAEDQLNFVFKYFEPWKGRLHSLADLYMAILWPKAVGKPDDFVLFEDGIAYRQNAGLDANRDHQVTKAETAAKLYAIRAEGLRAENVA
jgi:hypothetical protein